MFGVELTCSDESCALVVEALGNFAELELLVCEECECTLQITAVWQVQEERLDPPDELPLAA